MFIFNQVVKREEFESVLSRKLLGSDGSLVMAEVTFKEGVVGYLHSRHLFNDCL